MRRRLRIDVGKGVGTLVGIDFRRRNLAAQHLCEDIVVVIGAGGVDGFMGVLSLSGSPFPDAADALAPGEFGVEVVER